jgi:hypothetical protein
LGCILGWSLGGQGKEIRLEPVTYYVHYINSTATTTFQNQ